MLLLLLLLHPAQACLFPMPLKLTLDPRAQDRVPPAPPEVSEVRVKRGRGPGGNGQSMCAPWGVLFIRVARPAGDPDGPDQVGYRIRRVKGHVPDHLLPPAEDALLASSLSLPWSDGPVDDQEPLDFTLALVPVDVAGNEGEPAFVVVSDPGSPDLRDRGCAATPGAGGFGVVVALGLAARRRRMKEAGRHS